MKKILALIFQNYQQFKIKSPYKKAIFSFALLIVVHIIFFQELISISNISNNWGQFNKVFLNIKFTTFFSLAIIASLFLTFRKDKLMGIYFTKDTLRRGAYVLLIYFLAVILLLFAIDLIFPNNLKSI
jgi:hypothetical protein